MKLLVATLIIGTILLQIACVPSVNPLYTDEDLIFDNSLIGVWSERDSRETWAFASCDNKLEYRLLHTDENGKKGEFSARLVQVEDKTFLDIVPINPGFAQNEFYQGHFFSTHTFVQIVKAGSAIRVSVLEAEWVKKVVAADPNVIRHTKIRGELVLTASPKEMQRFLLANLTNREAFSEPEEMIRKKRAS